MNLINNLSNAVCNAAYSFENFVRANPEMRPSIKFTLLVAAISFYALSVISIVAVILPTVGMAAKLCLVTGMLLCSASAAVAIQFLGITYGIEDEDGFLETANQLKERNIWGEMNRLRNS